LGSNPTLSANSLAHARSSALRVGYRLRATPVALGTNPTLSANRKPLILTIILMMLGRVGASRTLSAFKPFNLDDLTFRRIARWRKASLFNKLQSLFVLDVCRFAG
jgi:hypothetical protein